MAADQEAQRDVGSHAGDPESESLAGSVLFAPVANKPKALSAARGGWDIFDVLQSHILPCPTASTSV